MKKIEEYNERLKLKESNSLEYTLNSELRNGDSSMKNKGKSGKMNIDLKEISNSQNNTPIRFN